MCLVDDVVSRDDEALAMYANVYTDFVVQLLFIVAAMHNHTEGNKRQSTHATRYTQKLSARTHSHPRLTIGNGSLHVLVINVHGRLEDDRESEM